MARDPKTLQSAPRLVSSSRVSSPLAEAERNPWTPIINHPFHPDRGEASRSALVGIRRRSSHQSSPQRGLFHGLRFRRRRTSPSEGPQVPRHRQSRTDGSPGATALEQCDLDKLAVVNLDSANPLLPAGFGGLLVIPEAVPMELLEVLAQQLNSLLKNT